MFFLSLFVCKVKVNGRKNIPKSGPFILASNHFGYFDPFVLVHAIRKPIDFIMQKELGIEPHFLFAPMIYGAILTDRNKVGPSTVKDSLKSIKNGKILGKYRKMHIPDDPQYYEKFYFTPGDLGFKSFKTNQGNLGTLICWDQWFPEAARLTSLQGAEILFYPTAIGWHPKEKKRYGKSQLNSWISVQRSHAIANGVYVAAVNRVGVEKQGSKKLEFWGNTIVFDPSGNIIAEAKLGEKTVICDIDFKQVENVRRHWPFFRDRRIDSYKGILNNPKDA